MYRWINGVPSLDEFRTALNNACQFWLISDDMRHLTAEHLEIIVDFFNGGRGIYIWGDNQPYYADANYVAEALFGTTMSGFTRLFINWDTAGTARYVSNAAAWLAHWERFGDEPCCSLGGSQTEPPILLPGCNRCPQSKTVISRRRAGRHSAAMRLHLSRIAQPMRCGYFISGSLGDRCPL